MKYRALLRHLERKLPEPPPDEIIIRWVDPNEPELPDLDDLAPNEVDQSQSDPSQRESK